MWRVLYKQLNKIKWKVGVRGVVGGGWLEVMGDRESGGYRGL